MAKPFKYPENSKGVFEISKIKKLSENLENRKTVWTSEKMMSIFEINSKTIFKHYILC